MPTEIAVAINMIRPLIARRMTLEKIIDALPDYAEVVVIEAYDHIRMLQFDRDRCGDALAHAS